MVVIFSFTFSKATNWQDCLAAPTTDISMFLMQIVAFGQQFWLL